MTNLANPSGFLTLPDVLRIARDLLRGLEYLHGNNLIHNDIKPENILIGSQHQSMLTDYGIVEDSRIGLDLRSAVFYKIHAAPEVIQKKEVSIETDIYQVGLTIFRLLVGLDVLRRMFNELGEKEYYEMVSCRGLVKTIAFPAYIPSRLRRIIQSASHIESSCRFASAIDMRRELEKLKFPGFWTVTHDGNFIGHNRAYEYRYEQKAAKGRYDVIAYKRSIKTKRETKISKYCKKNLPNSEAKRQIESFVRAVVEGKF